MKNYAVVKIEILNYQGENLESFLVEKTAKLNKVYEKALYKKFHSHQNSLIEAVFLINFNLTKILRQILYYFLPQQLKIGVGIGKIIDELSYNNGAYERANRSFLKTKKSKKSVLRFETETEGDELMLNGYYNLIDIIRNKWTEKQWEAIICYEKYNSYKLVAEKLNIGISAAHERVKSANWYEIKDVESIVQRQILKKYI